MRVEGGRLEHKDQALWVAELTSIMASRRGDRAAIICGEHTTTYNDLDRGSALLCAAWEEAGRKPGDRIAYLGPNSDLFFYVMFACARGGYLLSAFNWRYAAPELTYVLADAKPALLIYDPKFEPLVTAALKDAALELELLLTEGGECRSLRKTLSGPPRPFPVRTARPEEPLLQFYTSGTTGLPKGVLLSHACISLGRQSDVENPRWRNWDDGTVTLSPMPNFHTAGANFVLMTLFVGGTCVLTGDPSSANLLRLLRQHDVDHLFVVANLVRLLLDEIQASGEPAPRIGHIHYGAAPMSPTLLERAIGAFGCRFTQYYGMTEAGGTTHFLAPEEHDVKRANLLKSVGLPVTGVTMEIRRPDGSLCDVDEPGEIWLKSDMMMNGYANKPAETAAALVDGWYRSGDGGRTDKEGFLYLTDRIKDMIITGGENVYPIEVENALRAHPSIADVAVVGLDDDKWGQIVAAIVELRPGAELSFDDVRSFAKERIAGYKSPRAVFVADALPRTPTAKIQRNVAKSAVSQFRRL